MSLLMNREQLRRRMNNNALQDTKKFPDPYITSALAAVQDDIAHFLGRDLALHAVTNEQGLVEYIPAGPRGASYFLELDHWPLVPATDISVFTALQLHYAVPFLTGTDVVPDFQDVLLATGQLTCLAPGAVAALAFQRGGDRPGMRAVTYQASYFAGYATGLGDPLRGDGSPLPAPPVPESVKDAVVLLMRERLAFDAAQNADPAQPRAGFKVMEKGGDQEDRWAAPAMSNPDDIVLGYGTNLAVAAQKKLARFSNRRRHLLAVV